MGSKKHISVNLRDLQRVMNKEEDDLPVPTSDKSNKFGATKNFEYKLSNNRWENEDNDDDFDLTGGDRNTEAEPDFSRVRQPPKPTVERKPQSTPSPPEETSTMDGNWRSKNFSPSSGSADSWRKLKSRDEPKSQIFEFRNSYNRGRPTRDSEMNRENRNEEGETSPSTKNDRFSCLGEPRDDQSPTRGSGFRDSEGFSRFDNDRRDNRSPQREERSRDDWGFIDRTRESRFNDDDRHRRTTTNAYSSFSQDRRPAEPSKKGLFVPSYRRNSKKEDTVEDIFMKAAGLTSETDKQKKEAVEPDKPKKEVQDNNVLVSKRNEIAKHNLLFKCSPETVELVEKYVLSLLNSEEEGDFPELDETESLVPSVLTCVIVAKNCELCKTLDQVKEKFKKVKKWLVYSTQNHENRKLLTEVVKSTNHWGYPSLSESVYLIEALFDSLYTLGIVGKEDFLEWFENDVDEIPNRVTLLLQLMNWKKWLAGEGFAKVVERPEPDEEEESDDEDDSDIEANVPKPVRLAKGVKFK